jgi:aspartate aminotransferase-like enzyme
VALRRGDAAAAVEAAGSAVAEALRTGLPTAWRAHRAMAEACRAAGDEQGAASHAAEAGRAVARVRDQIHDRSIRKAFESAVAGGPFSEGEGRWG